MRAGAATTVAAAAVVLALSAAAPASAALDRAPRIGDWSTTPVGDMAEAVPAAALPDGGAFVAGTLVPGRTADGNVLLARLDASGVAAPSFGGGIVRPNSVRALSAIAALPDGALAVTGPARVP